MPRIVREADDHVGGHRLPRVGRRHGATSSAAFELPVTIASRIADPEGKTSPEELLAAAHATCFVTSLGSELHRAGTPAERIDVHCTITMDEVEGAGHLIVASEISAAPSHPVPMPRRSPRPPKPRTRAARSRR